MWHWRAHPSSLRRRLWAAMVSSVVAISGVAAVLDYQREHQRGVDRVILSLEEQASALEAAHLLIPEPNAFGTYVDRYCAAMDERISPGHHILILDARGAVLAGSRHHSGPRVEQALLNTTGSHAVIDAEGHRLAYVRSRDMEGHTFVVAQYLDRVEAALDDQLLRRALPIIVMALTTVLFIYLAVTYWVIGPLEKLIGAAQRWSGRDFSARALLCGPSDLQVVAREFNSMAGQLEVHEQRRLNELEEARQIQANLLPRLSSEIGGLTLAAEYRPAAYVAGDLYDVFGLADGRTVVAVLDVCGHGISAALLTGVVKIALRHHVAACTDLSEAVCRVNSDIVACTSDCHFVTACVGIWSPRDRSWTYCAAGHPGGILVHEGKTTALASTGPLLGVLPDGLWSLESVRIAPQDRLALYTDGVVEAQVNGRPFGVEGLQTALERTCNLGLSQQAQAVLQKIGPPDVHPAADDATLVIVQFRSVVAAAASPSASSPLRRNA
jgi:serine phosphatase RsbU (regulator of sigma subunit)